MFKHLIISQSMLLWLGIPFGISLLLAIGLDRYWQSAVKETTAGGKKVSPTFKYKLDVFMNPINAALTVSGFVIPLLCAGIGYFALQSVDAKQLVPLLASVMLFVLAVVVGLLNLFSMTSTDGEHMIIKQGSLSHFIPQFIFQMLLMMGGIVVIAVYFMVVFDLPQARASEANTNVVMIGQTPLRTDMTLDEVMSGWGKPDSVQTTTNGLQWQYDTLKSHFIIQFKSGKVWSVTERSK